MHFRSFFLLLFVPGYLALAQAPAGYYNSATGLTGTALQQALHNIIKNHNVQLYSNLYSVFDSSDLKTNTQVWDMYSDIPSGTPPYVYYNIAADRCGSYTQEGDCFNREHSWPQSWFNYSTGPVYSDAFHIFPTDGWVNAQRSNYPFGEVNNASWTSQNGSKLGNNTTVGYSQTVFEPIDEYKGDIARGLLYTAVRYLGEDSTWSTSPATNKATLLPWYVCLLLKWHNQDPVSSKEVDRNDAIYTWQNNRNPFIDRPGLADSAFTCTLIGIQGHDSNGSLIVAPNPCNESISVELDGSESAWIRLDDLCGRQVGAWRLTGAAPMTIPTSDLSEGFYLLSVSAPGVQLSRKVIIKH